MTEEEKPAIETYPCFVKVGDDDLGENFIELPTETDGKMLLSTIQSQFPNAIGLKYKSASGSWRGVRISDNVLDPPFEGWKSTVFVITLPKSDKIDSGKRKMEESPNREPEAKLVKTGSENEYLSDLIVLGLPYKATEADLNEYFKQFGELAMQEVKYDPYTKQSRGFAFIRFKTVVAAQKALKETHNIMGRRCELRLPKKKEDLTLKKLFVGRLPDDTKQEDLHSIFNKYGELTDVYIPSPFRGFGFVTFATSQIAQKALNGNNVLKGIRLNVTPAEPKGDQRGMGRGFQRSSRGNYRDTPFDFEAMREVMPYHSRGGPSSFTHYHSSRRSPTRHDISHSHDSRSSMAYSYSNYQTIPAYAPPSAYSSAPSYDPRTIQYGTYWSTGTSSK